MNDNFQHFDSYRRQRNKRRLEGAPHRDLGDNALVLRQLEAAEQKEVREQQLTREVHEFFAAATKQAAGIVAAVTENAEEQLDATVSRDMSEFLRETIRRAQELMAVVQSAEKRGVARQEFEPHMQNLVGPALDGFRYAGNVSTADQHIGRDPFDVALERGPAPADAPVEDALSPHVAHEPVPAAPLAEASPTPSPQTGLATPGASLEAVPMPAQPAVDAKSTTTAPTGSALDGWFRRLGADHERAKEALKLLVRAALMTKDEARAAWHELHTTRV
jgi:hypothetical protein